MPTTDKPDRPLADNNLDPLFDILERFESAWQGSDPPVIEDYLEQLANAPSCAYQREASAEGVGSPSPAPQAGVHGYIQPRSSLRPGQDERRQLLLELVDLDIECRWRAGQEIRVEGYFQRYPELAADRETAFRLITTEYSLRRRRERSLTPEAYQDRFPQYRDELPARLLALPKAESATRASFPSPAGVPPQPEPPSHLSCPHCHKAIALSSYAELGEGTGSLKQLICSSCGGSFRFDAGHVPAWSPQALLRLGQFELLKEVGQGAFGTVYRARDTELSRIVAVKVPRGGRWFTPVDEDRFVREARNVAQLAHRGIVPIYEVGRAAPVPYLVSAYVEGQTLAKILASRRFGFREAAEIGAQVAEALDHAHRRGVVHRDLKPSNIMLGQIEGAASLISPAACETVSGNSGSARTENSDPMHAFVMDFGLSRRDDGEITVTLEGQVLGTPAYMSPEQARGEGHRVDGRSDVYSLGVILYELLTGGIPFRGVTRMVLQQIQLEEPTAPRRLNDKIPRDLETITLKCMAKEPGRRYATASEVAADLRRYLKGEPIVARPVTRLERCWRWSKRNPVVASLLSLVIVLLVTVAVGSAIAAIRISHERDTANAQLNLALNTLDQLVDKVNDQLRDKPTMHKLAESLLYTAIKGLEQAAHNQPTPRAINESWNTIAAANQRLGDIYLMLGQTGKAQEYSELARRQLEAYVAANPRTTTGRHNLAVSYSRLGKISRRKGDLSASREYYRKALEIDQALTATNPRDLAVLRDLCDIHVDCAELESLTEHKEAALSEYQMALELARTAAEIEPHDPAYKQILGGRHYDIGELLVRSGSLQEASRHFDAAVKLYEEVMAADPDSRNAQRMLALAHQGLGTVNLLLLQLRKALDHARLAVNLLEKLAAADPQNALVGHDLGRAYTPLANIYTRLGDFAAVREAKLKSVLITKKWAAADPDNLTLQTDLSFAYCELGRTEMNLRRYQEAAQNFEQGAAILQDQQRQGKLKDQPGSQRMLAVMEHKLSVCRAAGRAIEDEAFALKQKPAVAAELLYIRAAVLAGRGQHIEAADAADKLCRMDPKNISYLYDAACAYALCAAGVAPGKAPGQLSAEEAAARKHYADRALETLSALTKLGFTDAVNIEVDPDFAAIRQEEGYRKLLASLKTPRSKNK